MEVYTEEMHIRKIIKRVLVYEYVYMHLLG